MSAVHLYMMELETDRQSGLNQGFAVFAPHHHRVAEQVCVLVDDAVEFGLWHGRGADDHVVFKETALTFVGGFGGQFKVILVEVLQVVGKRNVARIDAAVAVGHNHVDGYSVVAEQFPFFGQDKEFLHFAGRLADAPTHQHGQFHAAFPTELQQVPDVHRFHQSHHWHWRGHPKAECLRPIALLRLNFGFHGFTPFHYQ